MTKGEVTVQRIWKEYFDDLYNIDTEEQVTESQLGELRSR